MRKTLLLLVLIMALAVPAMCAGSGDNKASAIPVPDGAVVLDSGSLDNAQINAQIDDLASSEPLPPSLMTTISSLKQALAPLKVVQYVSMKLPGSKPMSEVISFFETSVPGKRIIYNIDGPGGLLLIATEDGGYFGAMVNEFPAAQSSDTKEIYAGRIFGTTEVGKAVAAVAPFFLGMESSMGDAPVPVRPAPKKPAVKKPVPSKTKRK